MSNAVSELISVRRDLPPQDRVDEQALRCVRDAKDLLKDIYP